jgi:sensitive to high expression protein 9, mitochondrial
MSISIEARINDVRQAAREAKTRYEKAVEQRSQSQREVNDLLQRKSTWTDSDVSRFTTLVREDHHYEQEEARAKLAVDESEAAVEREFTELTRTILARYHEEQVWSDKIRSASTYGQLAALGLNLLVFVLAIVLVEPWKRKRLAQTFEKKIEEMEAEYRDTLDDNVKRLQEQLEDQTKVLLALSELVSKVEAAKISASEEVVEEKDDDEPPLTTETWTKAVKDRHFGEAVATGAVAASIIGALGWIWLGG